jgi:flagellar basal body-associated protein FliL
MNQENPEVEGVDIPAGEMEEAEATGGQKAPTKQLNMIMFSVIVVLLFGFQAVSSVLIIGKMYNSNPYFPGKAPVEQEEDLTGMIHTLEGIIVNPTESRGKVLLVDIGFETGSEEVVAELGTLEPLLRDNLNTFLAAQRLPVLTDISMRDKIRGKVMDIANYHLTEGKVGRVFFIRYVLQ